MKTFSYRPLAAAVVAALLATPVAHAFEFQHGDLQGSWDTTVSYGISWRMEEQDPRLIGRATINPLIGARGATLPGPLAPLGRFPGTPEQNAAPGRYSANRDDGNRKYKNGDPISNAFKVTSELSLRWHEWGAFTRATYFKDFENEDRTDLTQTAKDLVGERFRLLDAFVYRDFAYGDGLGGTVRLGRQVMSWGESTFISNGINVINPVDLSALRVAGAELKEAFLPVDSLWGSFQVNENISIEGVLLAEFEEIEVDAAGTYFSANDFASPGGTYAMLGFGTAPQPVENPELYYNVCTGTPAGWAQSDRLAGYLALGLPPATALGLVGTGCGASFRRGPNDNAKDSGQYGAAVHWLSPWHDTEFGFYYLNYHSRLPLLSGYAATGAPGTSPTTATGAPNPNFGRPTPGASVVVEYPEDIDLYGLSWNTLLGTVAFQGEVSYRPNAPLQFDDVELLFAALSPLNPAIPVPAADFVSQLGQFGPGQYIQGWDRYKVWQLQSTFTKVFGEVLGADQISLVGEVGGTYMSDLPDESERRFEGEGTDTGGGCDVNHVGTMTRDPTTGAWTLTPFPGGTATPGCLRNPQQLGLDQFPDDFSWGYRLAARADYNSVGGGPFNVSPRIAFNHDVHGTTPGPGGNFLDGRKSFTIGVEANYLQQWVFDLSLTRFSGTLQSQIIDRDFASFSVKYSF